MNAMETPLGAIRGRIEDGYLAVLGFRHAQAPWAISSTTRPVPPRSLRPPAWMAKEEHHLIP